MSSLAKCSQLMADSASEPELVQNPGSVVKDGDYSRVGCVGCVGLVERSPDNGLDRDLRGPRPVEIVELCAEQFDWADLRASHETLSWLLSKAAKHPVKSEDSQGTELEHPELAYRGVSLATPRNASLSRLLIRHPSPNSATSSGHVESQPAGLPESTPEESTPAQYDLEARFFSHFTVFHSGRELPLPAEKNASAILKYLMAHKGRPVSQDYLRGWLWPESSPAKARLSLNSAIYSLRRYLSAELSPESSSSYVLLEAGHYRLSSGIRVSLDTEDFDYHYERGRRLEREQYKQEAIAEYREALALYRGDYLSESLYEGAVDWTTIERERLSEAYMDMLTRLADYYLENGQFRESTVVCYRLLKKDCCHEDAYRILMRCCARLGLGVRALHHYRLCKQTLADQYGMDTSPETEALYKSLLRGESI